MIMTSLTILDNTTSQTMSSRELAQLTDKRHPDVKRDIQNMCNQLEIDVSSFAHIYLDSSNRSQTEYRLPRRECEILVTGYNVRRRAAVIDRWMELEMPTRQSLTPIQMIAQIASSMVAQEAAMQQVTQSVESHSNRLSQIEHTLSSRGCRTGYMLLSEASRAYRRGLSESLFKELVEIYEVDSADATIQSVHGIIMTKQVKEAEVSEMMEVFYEDLVQVSPRRYTHPLLGNRKFQA